MTQIGDWSTGLTKGNNSKNVRMVGLGSVTETILHIIFKQSQTHKQKVTSLDPRTFIFFHHLRVTCSSDISSPQAP